MELGVSHVQNLSSLTPIVDNIFDKYNKNLVPIRSLSDHDIMNFYLLKNTSSCLHVSYNRRNKSTAIIHNELIMHRED